MDWLLLIHQIPAKPTYFRAKIWRRLQQLGAIPIKQAAYAMPKQEQAYEDLTWIAKEIIDGGGEAILLEARLQEGLDDAQVINLFCEARQRDYQRIAAEADELLAHCRQHSTVPGFTTHEYKAGLAKIRKAFAGITAIDFFPVAERSKVEAMLADMETILQHKNNKSPILSQAPDDLTNLQGKIWTTRANVYADRMACAWLIQRYIDHAAIFKFVGHAQAAVQADEICFDMPTGQFSHEGEFCTFEVMARRFGPDDPALQKIAHIIHDIDLKDEAFNLPETDGIHALFDGIVAAEVDDLERIRQIGIVLDSLLIFFRNSSSNIRAII